MVRYLAVFLLLVGLFFSLNQNSMPRGPKEVALCVVATGKYVRYVSPLIASARKYFCAEHDVTYFVFTDQEIEKAPDVVRIEQKRLGWPYDTLKRFHMYAAQKERLSKFDYIFAVDADVVFVGDVGGEILSRRVFTRHPGYINRRGPYEQSRLSSARVGKKQMRDYMCGGVYGGNRRGFFHFIEKVIPLVDRDLSQGVIAAWHDESYLNRYCIDYPPTKILSPSYCYPESWDFGYEKKIVVLDKDHDEVRE